MGEKAFSRCISEGFWIPAVSCFESLRCFKWGIFCRIFITRSTDLAGEKRGYFLGEKWLETGKTSRFLGRAVPTLLCLQRFTENILDQATRLLSCPADLKRFPWTHLPWNSSSRRRHLTEDLSARWGPFRWMQQEPSLYLLFFWIPPSPPGPPTASPSNDPEPA